ncbi:MAG: aminotransferase class V-fold PLP-dependent enzyme [Thermoleophilia bacterium]|nr:aminotransferase class V-fold PLP-dependent enzyme [Gaiellaceae bacterium]MDW8338528.1 aminotransferase class V-fold PLP-dependent enzyme [Thermoleophilia bacterium]
MVGHEARARFPIFEHTVYANSCSQGALSLDVRRAYEEYLAGWDAHGAEWEHWVERAETARAAFARLVGADPDEVAVTSSVSQAVSALVSAIALDRGRHRIVITELEFPAVGQIAHAQELRGAEVVHVEPDADGRIPPERFAAAIDERTALVCCTAVSYRTGARLDVAEVARIARERGALCLVDAYQAAGALPLDVRALGCDALAAGTVKYLLASAGLAFLFVRRELHERLLPTQTGWFADEDIFAMDISDYSPAPNARRFDAGTPPVPSIYAGVAGMAIVEEAGVPAIAAHVRGLVDRLLAGLDELGATVATPRAEGAFGPLVCVASSDVHALVEALRSERVAVSSRDRNLRIALHLYNVEEDVDRILAALASHRDLLA